MGVRLRCSHAMPRIAFTQEPLRKDYLAALDCCKRDQPRESSRQFLANLCNRHGAAVVAEVLAAPCRPDAMSALLLQESDHAEGINDAKHELARTFIELAVRMAGNRAWSLCQWEMPPEQWTGVLSSNVAESGAAFERMKGDCKAVKKAIEAARSDDHPSLKAWPMCRAMSTTGRIIPWVRLQSQIPPTLHASGSEDRPERAVGPQACARGGLASRVSLPVRSLLFRAHCSGDSCRTTTSQPPACTTTCTSWVPPCFPPRINWKTSLVMLVIMTKETAKQRGRAPLKDCFSIRECLPDPKQLHISQWPRRTLPVKPHVPFL